MSKKDISRFDEEISEEEFEELSESDKVKYLVRQGVNRTDISEIYGINSNTVRTIWSTMKGLGELPKNASIGSKGGDEEDEEEHTKTKSVLSSGTKLPKMTPARMSPAGKIAPPEHIINNMQFQGMDPNYNEGLRAGMSMVVMAVRIVQELTSLGVQQTAPLIAMAKEMRTGESEMIKAASKEAAYDAAGAVMHEVAPMLNQLSQEISNIESKENDYSPSTGNVDPFKKMMVKQMEPIFNKMFGSMMSSLGNIGVPGMQQQAPMPQGQEKEYDPNVPDGWLDEEEFVE